MIHLIDSKEVSRKEMEDLFVEADKLADKGTDALKGRIMAALFFEPSTRTRFSFETAMLRLGGNVISAENAREFSSAAKGETIEDTIKTVGNYADIIVMRHFEEGAAAAAAGVSAVPVINAGDGANQHPSQALLDLYTIQKELGKIDDISVILMGDLKNGRTIKSLLWAFSKFKNVKIILVSPPGLKLQKDYFDHISQTGLEMKETDDLESVIGDADVVYQTRIQKERFADPAEYQKYKGSYRLDVPTVSKMKKGSILMHPLPRVDEISPDVDSLPQAAYFKQVKNSVPVRMAILKWLLENK